MPATAGRVRMPANNRVHSSAALQTHGIWQSAIGYDPYAPNKDDTKNSSQPKSAGNEPDADNPYNSYQGLLALARITNTNADEARGSCKKCGRVGHLTFQCRNFLSVKDDNKEKDPEAIQAAVLSELDKIKGKVGKVNGKGKTELENESEEEEEESDSSDSDADSEIERIIAERYGKKVSNKGRSSRRKKMGDSDEDVSDSDSGRRKKRGRSKKRSGKRRHSDSEGEDEGCRKRRREKTRKRAKSSDDEDERQHHRRKSMKEKRRRRSHRHSDDSDSDTSEDSVGRYKRKSRRSKSSSDLDGSGSDDSRVGRGTKRSKKKSRKRHHKVDE
ncbi:CAX-interacting protein 4-like [Melia azedarach]|uniref:CAX-interacting protein 4-like n=1 Tax=Melia azedarach TaxID=155640 RepID=A0ACC1YPU9_MELAZ|nr:CAX-interacting protein 4-like [Melia azedarach]